MELKGRNLTPELFCILVDSLYQTGSLRNHTLEFRGKTYSHFGPGRYYIDDMFVSLAELLQMVKDNKYDHRESFIYVSTVITINKGKIITPFKLFEGVGKGEVINNAVRWFDRTKEDEINLLKSVYKTGLLS